MEVRQHAPEDETKDGATSGNKLVNAAGKRCDCSLCLPLFTVERTVIVQES